MSDNDLYCFKKIPSNKLTVFFSNYGNFISENETNAALWKFVFAEITNRHMKKTIDFNGNGNLFNGTLNVPRVSVLAIKAENRLIFFSSFFLNKKITTK